MAWHSACSASVDVSLMHFRMKGLSGLLGRGESIRRVRSWGWCAARMYPEPNRGSLRRRSRSCRSLWNAAACGLFCLASAGSVPAQMPPAPASIQGTQAGWSMPSAIPGVPIGSALKWPSISQFGDTVYVAGNVLPTTRLRSGPHPMTILRIPGRPLQLPTGNFEFAYPKGVFDSKGAYHLVWGEPVHPDSATWRYGAHISSLWHAVFKNDRWTEPVKIADAISIHWDTEQGAIATDSKNRVHVISPAETRPGPAVLLHTWETGSGWSNLEIPWLTAYASMVVWRGDSIVVCFAGENPSHSTGAHNLFITMSGDGGLHWSVPQPLNPGDGGVAVAPIVLVAGNELHVVSGQTAPGRLSSSMLKHWRRQAGGRGWDPLPSVALTRAQVIRFVAAGVRCGVVEAAVESLVGAGDSLRIVVDEARWAGDNASATQLFPDFRNATSVALLGVGNRFRLVAAVANPPAVSVGAVTATQDACSDDQRQ